MVLSHRNHGNFSKKLTCFLNPNQKEKPKCQNFSEINNYELCIVHCGVPTDILLQKLFTFCSMSLAKCE